MKKSKLKLSPEYWLAWRAKFFSLFASGKIIMYVFGVLIPSWILLEKKLLTSADFGKIIVAAVAIIIALRGFTQVADMWKNRNITPEEKMKEETTVNEND